MFKYLKILFGVVLCLFSVAGMGQQITISAPAWVNDMGGRTGSASVVAQRVDAQNNVYVTGTFSGTVNFDRSPGVKNLTSSNNSVDIFVAKYDTNGALTWVVAIGDTSTDKPNGLAVDLSGKVTITGQYNSPKMDADPGPGVFNLVNSGGNDMFLINLDTNGNFLWAKSIGGTGTDIGYQVGTDDFSNRIVVGAFQSAITLGGTTYTSTGAYNGLIVKYDPLGNLLWAINLGATGDNGIRSLAVDGSENIIVAGSFSGTVNFNPLGVADNLTATGTTSFIAKYSPTGQLVWVYPVNGNIVKNAANIFINLSNDVYVTGPFTGALTFGGSATINATGAQDVFLVRYFANGAFQFAKDIIQGLTPATKITSTGIAIGNDNNVYITGYFSGNANFDPNGSIDLIDHGQQDLFIAKYTSVGGNWWANNTGNGNGCGNVTGQAVSIDNSGNILLSGSFCSVVNFDFINCTAFNVTAQSMVSDAYIAKYLPGSSIPEQNVISIPTTTALCAGSVPGVITGSTAFNGAGPPVYQWQSSADSVNFTAIAGATSQNYALPVVNATTWYRRSATSGNCFLPALSNVVKIAIQPALANNTITAPGTTIFCTSGDPAVITGNTPTGGDGVDYAYQWQSSADGVTFTNIAGATTINYDPPLLTATAYYQRLTTSGNCTTPLNSNIISIQIQPALANNVITAPTVTFFCGSGDPAMITGSTPTGGDGVNYTYQWQSSTDNVTFTAIAGATAINFDPPVISATTYFNRIATSGICTTPLISNTITINVQPAIINNVLTPPPVVDFCLTGDPAIITGAIPTGGNGVFSYQWQSSADSVTFTDIPGVTSKDYDPPLLNNITYYQRTVISGNCSAISNTVTIIIQTPILNNVITVPPASGVCLISGSTPTGGTGHFTYQWQSSVNNVAFTDITGATAQNYDPAASGVTTYYRRIAISGTCFPSVTSNTVVITALAAIANNTITAPPTVVFCASGDPGSMNGSNPSGGNGTYLYQWQSSADGVTFADIAGATAINYDPAVINSTAYYRRIVFSGPCLTPSISSAVIIQIQPAIANNVITPPPVTIFCIGGNAANISGSAPTGGDGATYVYQWQNSTDGVNFSNISGATSIDYDPPQINITTWYQRIVISSGACLTPVISNMIELQVQPALAGNAITPPAVVNFCTLFDPDLITGNTPTGGSGIYTYQWQTSTNNVTFTDIAGATAKDYDPPVITATTYYRRNVISGACTVLLSSNVVTIIQDPPVVAGVSADVAICVASSAVLNATGGTSYLWSPAAGLSNANMANPTASPSVTTTYTVTVFKGTCSATATVTVNVIQMPANVSAGSGVTIVKGETVQLYGSATGSNLQYSWSPVTYLDNPNIINPVATPQTDITYTLFVTAPNNCFVISAQVAIKVFANITIPNTFTPNADGINDTWNIPSLAAYPNCQVSVFNRYGQEVFKSRGYAIAWDGTYNGKPLPTGTYYYTVDLKNGSKIIAGWVAVIR